VLVKGLIIEAFCVSRRCGFWPREHDPLREPKRSAWFGCRAFRAFRHLGPDAKRLPDLDAGPSRWLQWLIPSGLRRCPALRGIAALIFTHGGGGREVFVLLYTSGAVRLF